MTSIATQADPRSALDWVMHHASAKAGAGGVTIHELNEAVTAYVEQSDRVITMDEQRALLTQVSQALTTAESTRQMARRMTGQSLNLISKMRQSSKRSLARSNFLPSTR